MFQFMVFNNPALDYKTLNFDADWAKVVAIEKGNINVLEPNLDRFAARGGKLIQYHGWADQQIPSGSSTRFFAAMESQAGGRAKLQRLLPDVHGAGDGSLRRRRRHDDLRHADRARAVGRAGKSARLHPGRRSVVNGKTERTRPLCPYPQVAKCSGHGSSDDAANFSCKAQ